MVALLALLSQVQPGQAADTPRVIVAGAAFRLTVADGGVAPAEAILGTTLSIGDGSGRQRRIRVDAAEPDPRDPSGAVTLYTLVEQAEDGS